MLCIVDEFTRESLATRVARKLKATEVIEPLYEPFVTRGIPNSYSPRKELPESGCTWKRCQSNETGILGCGFSMRGGFPVNRVADDLDKSRQTWIFRNKAKIPTFVIRSDKHRFKPALPNDFTTQASQHRFAHAAVSLICLGTTGFAIIGICSALTQADEVEQMHDAFAIAFAKCDKTFFSEINVTCHYSSPLDFRYWKGA